ncbi:uncharacterized protein LOC100177974 [Ciona intestinalis]
MQAPINPAPQVTMNTLIPTARQPTTSNKYAAEFRGIGIAELVFGSICFVLGIIGIVPPLLREDAYDDEELLLVAAGIWGGVFIAVSGLLAFLHSKNPTSCLLKGNLTVSILSAVMSTAIIIVGAFSATNTYIYCYDYVENQYLCPDMSLTILHGITAFFGLVSLCLSITQSAYCCKASSGGNKQKQQVMSLQNQGHINMALQYPSDDPSQPNVIFPNQRMPIGYRSVLVPIYPEQNADAANTNQNNHHSAFMTELNTEELKTTFGTTSPAKGDIAMWGEPLHSSDEKQSVKKTSEL